MANPFKPVIDKLKDQSDKDGSKKLLYQAYKKQTIPQRDKFVEELIHQMMEYKEKAEYLYQHHFNEN